jgi:spore maturation protein CgeB
MPRQLLEAARSFVPDLVFMAKAETVPAETVRTIRSELRCSIINWFPDARLFGYDSVFAQLPYLDWLFSKSEADVQRMRMLGFGKGRLLEHCADRSLHIDLSTPEEELKPYRCQVAMVGSFYPYREAILRHLSDVDLRIWGPGWGRSSLYRTSPQTIVDRDARSEEQTRVFRAASVNLNTHHFDDVSDLNQRVFDIAGAGGCQVMDGDRDHQNIFEKPDEIAQFRSVDELREWVRFLIENPRKRQEMGGRCQRKIAGGHTYDHRIREILDLLKM